MLTMHIGNVANFENRVRLEGTLSVLCAAEYRGKAEVRSSHCQERGMLRIQKKGRSRDPFTTQDAPRP